MMVTINKTKGMAAVGHMEDEEHAVQIKGGSIEIVEDFQHNIPST